MWQKIEKNIFILLQTTLSNMLQILSIFMDIKYSTSIIFVPNLKEIKPWEDVFYNFKCISIFVQRRKTWRVIFKSAYLINHYHNQY